MELTISRAGLGRKIFRRLPNEVVKAGVDAVEVSGGMWDCLARPEKELGFRPVPSPESHTRIWETDTQSYFLPYASQLNVDVPIILVGGNRDIESLENILKTSKVDFIALCRPLIREPGLPKRWIEGKGSNLPACVSCNSCLYDMYMHPGRKEPGPVGWYSLTGKGESTTRPRSGWRVGWKRTGSCPKIIYKQRNKPQRR